MRKMNRWIKVAGVLMAGGMMVQFGGCGGLSKQIGIGFGASLGAVPGNIVGCFGLGALGQACNAAAGFNGIVLGD